MPGNEFAQQKNKSKTQYCILNIGGVYATTFAFFVLLL